MSGSSLSLKLDPQLKLQPAQAARLLQAHLDVSLVVAMRHLTYQQMLALNEGHSPVVKSLVVHPTNPGYLIYCGPPENPIAQDLPDYWSNVAKLIQLAQRVGASYLRFAPGAPEIPADILEACHV